MMEARNYAVVDAAGDVINTVLWDGTVFTPAVEPDGDNPGTPAFGWSPPEGDIAVEVPDGLAVSTGWKWDGTNFIAPVVTPTPPSAEEILVTNTAKRNALLAAANLVIPALQDAVDLGDPSANPVLLKAWKQFRVDVNKVNLTQENPPWPTAPQPGYGAAITWPVSSS